MSDPLADAVRETLEATNLVLVPRAKYDALVTALKDCGEQLALLAKDPHTNPWVQQALAALRAAGVEPEETL